MMENAMQLDVNWMKNNMWTRPKNPDAYIQLGQRPVRHQAITWTNADSLSHPE